MMRINLRQAAGRVWKDIKEMAGNCPYYILFACRIYFFGILSACDHNRISMPRLRDYKSAFMCVYWAVCKSMEY